MFKILLVCWARMQIIIEKRVEVMQEITMVIMVVTIGMDSLAMVILGTPLIIEARSLESLFFVTTIK